MYEAKEDGIAEYRSADRRWEAWRKGSDYVEFCLSLILGIVQLVFQLPD